MKFFVVRLSFLSVLSLLSGCGFLFGDDGVFRNRSNDYLKTGSIKEIELPDGMTSTNLVPIYSIPDVEVVDEFGDAFSIVEYDIPMPDQLNIDKAAAGVKLQKLDGERWIFVKASPAQVWPRTQNFLSEYGIRVAKSDPYSGVIESDWVTFRDDDSMRSRFKLTLEKGIHQETTEIHVRQLEVLTADAGLSVPAWPSQSVNSEREDWLIDNLSQELAKNIDNSSASLLGLNVGGELKASFSKKNGEPVIRIHLSPNRTWATLLYSSRQEAFRNWESSEPKGILYLDYNDELTKKRGFFQRLAFWNKPKTSPETALVSLDELLSHLDNNSDVKALFGDIQGVSYAEASDKPEGYLLVVKREGDYSYVYLRDAQGNRLPILEAKQKLRMLRKNLI